MYSNDVLYIITYVLNIYTEKFTVLNFIYVASYKESLKDSVNIYVLWSYHKYQHVMLAIH